MHKPIAVAGYVGTFKDRSHYARGSARTVNGGTAVDKFDYDVSVRVHVSAR